MPYKDKRIKMGKRRACQKSVLPRPVSNLSLLWDIEFLESTIMLLYNSLQYKKLFKYLIGEMSEFLNTIVLSTKVLLLKANSQE